MANYVDAGTQTRWAGLMQKEPVRPEALFSPQPNTSTPPDEMMVTEKVQFSDRARRHSITTPERSPTQQHHHATVTSTSPLLARRLNRHEFVAHIDLPSPDLAALDDEVPISPPASAAIVLSPLPEANKRFAGHTPLFPGSPSQKSGKKAPSLYPPPNFNVRKAKADQLLQYQAAAMPPDDENQAATPQEDIGLTGPLMLAPHPGDGAADHIALDVLDQELSKIAQLQSRDQSDEDEDKDPGLAQQEPNPQGPTQQNVRDMTGIPPPQSTGNSALSSRKGSADSRRSEDIAPVDGVMLKRAPLNFGAPFGEV
jgi:hypothetical protein